MLALGLVTTLAIVWCCAWFMRLEVVKHQVEISRVELPRWVVWTHESLGTTHVESFENSNTSEPRELRTHWWSHVRTAPTHGFDRENPRHMIESAAGWPWPALMWEADLVYPQMPTTAPTGAVVISPQFQNLRWGWAPTSPRQSTYNKSIEGVLPLRPLWRGLLANMALFAVAWAIVIAGFRAGRRLSRQRRGYCAHCGYWMWGLEGTRCPECGTTNTAAAARADRRVLRFSAVVFALALGAGTTIGVAWACALWAPLDAIKARQAWLTDLPSLWLLQRLDGFGSTRLAWLYDTDTARMLEDEQSMRERVLTRSEVPEANHLRAEAMLTKDRDERIAEQRARAPVDPSLIPEWMPAALATPHRRDNRRLSFVRDARGWPLPAMWMQFDGPNADPADSEIKRQSCQMPLGGIPIAQHQRARMLDATALPLRVLWPGFAINSAIYATGWLALMTLSWLVRGARVGGSHRPPRS